MTVPLMPLVAFLPDKSSTSWPGIRAAGGFCVNILSAGQEALCAQFARKGIDKFAGVAWRAAPSGAPILEGGMAWIDCELTQTFSSGDHYIAIGRVLQLEAAEYGAPLVFFQGGYGHFEAPRLPADGLVDELVGGYVRAFHDERYSSDRGEPPPGSRQVAEAYRSLISNGLRP
jgi:flavin reductase (DIM6/NTAB) family NADH-FMN oxidoreductase RutF